MDARHVLLRTGQAPLLPPRFPEKGTRFSNGVSPAYLSKFKEKIGAGDGIRTHDPNLGKVVLYP